MRLVSRSDKPQLSVILDRFDAAWASGIAPEITDFLPGEADESTPSRQSVLMELVMIDLERRWRTGTSEAAEAATVAAGGGNVTFPTTDVIATQSDIEALF